MIDDHPLVRLGVRGALGDGFEVQESCSHEEALDLLRDVDSFDVAILDTRRNGHDSIKAIRRAEPTLAIVAHGERPERHLATAALQAGALAYVCRTSQPADLRRAVEAALAHKEFVDANVPPKGSRGVLTGRQRQILQLLAAGQSTTIAARRLDLSEETVKTHMKHILARLNAKNRTHAVAIALRNSLIE